MGTTHGNFVKYPRTPHLFGSTGTSDDNAGITVVTDEPWENLTRAIESAVHDSLLF